MRRRGLLGVFGWLASLTCCGTQARPEASATSSADPVGSNSGVDLPFSESVLIRNSRRDEIPAITDLVFGEDWRGIELEVMSELGERYLTRPRLVDADLVIRLEVEGDARAYPVNVLQFHEFVHDSLGGLTRNPLPTLSERDGRQSAGTATANPVRRRRLPLAGEPPALRRPDRKSVGHRSRRPPSMGWSRANSWRSGRRR